MLIFFEQLKEEMMISLDQVYGHLRQAAAARTPAETERIATHLSLGRVLAEDATCGFDHPSFHQSAMDGVALRAVDGEASLELIGTVAAGDVPDQFTLKPGQCVRIMTGAPVPSSADTVAMIEDCVIEGDRVQIQVEVTAGRHVRVQGENHRKGDTLYSAGTRIGPGVIAGLMSQGVRYVAVKRRLRIGLVTGGEELVDYRRPLRPGQVYNLNGVSVGAVLQHPDHEIADLGHLPDRMEPLRDLLATNADLDILVLSGGVSMGAFDLTPKAAEAAGFSPVFHKVRMKPGKPLWFGRHAKGCLLFGLPGNPVSSIVGAMLFVKPTARGLQTGSFREPHWTRVMAADEIRNPSGLTRFFGVCLTSADGETTAKLLETSGSGDIARFGPFEALARLAPGQVVQAGEAVQIFLSSNA